MGVWGQSPQLGNTQVTDRCARNLARNSRGSLKLKSLQKPFKACHKIKKNKFLVKEIKGIYSWVAYSLHPINLTKHDKLTLLKIIVV